MTDKIFEWIEKINSGEEVILNNFSELLDEFSFLDLSVFFPDGVILFNSITLKTFEITLSEDNVSYEFISFQVNYYQNYIFNNKYVIERPIIYFSFSDNQDTLIDVYIEGGLQLYNKNTIPIIISNNEDGWILQSSDKIDNTSKMFFSDFKDLVSEVNFTELIEEELYPHEHSSVGSWLLSFSGNEYRLSRLYFKVASKEYNINDILFLNLKDVLLEYSISIPFDGTIDTCFIEGKLYAGSEELPQIRMSLPFDDSEGRYIQMLDGQYTINSFAPLTALLSGLDLNSLLPSRMQSFSDIVISNFSFQLNSEKNGFENLSVGLKSLNEDNSWQIIPGQLEMKNISMDFYFPNTYLVLSGTVLFGETALPLKTTLQVGEGIIPEYITFELNFNDDIYELPVKPGEISIGGLSFLNIFPGLDDFELLLRKMAFEFHLSDSLSLNRYALAVACNQTWSPFSFLEFGNIKIDLDYFKPSGSEEGSTEAAFYAELIKSGGNIPVKVFIPSAGDWSLELGEEGASQGIAIPGLQDISDLVNIDVSGIVPSGLLFEGITLADLYIGFPHPAEQKINTVFAEFYLSSQWSFTDQLIFKDLRFRVETDFTGSEETVNFQVMGTIEIAGVEVTASAEKTTGEWIFTIEDTALSLSLDSLKDLIPFASNISVPGFISNILNVSININSLQMVYTSSMDKLKEFSYNIALDKSWKIADNIIELKELEVEYRAWNLDQADSSKEGTLYSNLVIGSFEIPTIVPLPFNEGDWTIQLAAQVTIPQLSYFTDFIGFNIDNILKELPGIDETPETTISRFDLKFETDPYKTEKFIIAFEFKDGYSISLPPGVEVRLDSIEVEYENKGTGSETSFVINGAIIEKIGKETTIPVILTKTPGYWQISAKMGDEDAVNIDVGLISTILPGINLPSKIAESGLDIFEINLKLKTGSKTEVKEFDVRFDLKGADNLIPVNILKKVIPVRALYEVKEGQGSFGLQMLEWPFTTGVMKTIADPGYDGWVLIDLGEFGAIKMELPKFITQGDSFIVNGEVQATHNGEKITIQDGNKTETFTGKGLNIPIKFLLDKMGLSFLNLVLPDRIPLAPEKDLRGIIRQAKGDPDNLPDNFQDYLDIAVPDGFQYDFIMGGKGDLSIKLSLPDSVQNGKEPVKILIPAGLNLVGLKIYEIGFSTIFGFPFLNIDIEFDSFLLPILVALSWFKTDKLDFIVDLKKINFHFNAKDVWLLLATVIPIPIFYDDLSFTYTGIEGASLETGIKLPRPGLEVADFGKIAEFMAALKKYITEKDYFLDPDTDLGNVDLKFTLGPTYAELPKYLSGKLLGKDDDIFTESAIGVLCEILNIMKDPSLPRFVEMIPEHLRFVEKSIDFGPIDTDLMLGFTSVEKIKKGAVEEYQSKILGTLFKDLDKGLLFIIYGHWAIGKLVDFEVMMGMSFKSYKGAGLQVGIFGSIGENFLSCKVTGVTVIDFENRSNPFIFDLQSELVLLGQTLASLETRIDNKGFYMRGAITLIDWAGFKVKSELSGSLDNHGAFLLAGDAEIEIAGLELLESSAEINNSSILVKNKWMGFSLNFYSEISNDNLIFQGEAKLPSFGIKESVPAFKVGAIEFKGLDIECTVKCRADMQVSKSGLEASIAVAFHFIRDFEFSISLPLTMKSFNDLKDFLTGEIIEKIKDALLGALEDGWKFLLELVGKGWAVVENIAGILKDVYGKSVEFITSALKEFLDFSAENIAAALKGIGAGAMEIAQSLNRVLGLAGHEISRVLQAIGTGTLEIAGALKDALNYTAEQMMENFKKLGVAIKDIAKALGRVFLKTAQQIADILKAMGLALVEIVGILGDALEFAAEAIADALKFIGATLEDISGALVNVLKIGAEELARALDFIKASVGDIAKNLAEFLGSAAAEVASALKSIGKSASEIADGLKNGLGTAAEAVAGILDDLSFSPSDIAGSLKDVYHFSGDAAAAMLKGMGKGAAEIATALSSIYKFSAGSIASALNRLNVPVGDIASALYNTLHFPPVRIADALKGIGSSAKVVADFFSSVSVPNIGNILEQVNFPDVDIKDVLSVIPCPDGWICPDCCIADCCVVNCCVADCCVGNGW